jgi:hypothetical protein
MDARPHTGGRIEPSPAAWRALPKEVRRAAATDRTGMHTEPRVALAAVAHARSRQRIARPVAWIALAGTAVAVTDPALVGPWPAAAGMLATAAAFTAVVRANRRECAHLVKAALAGSDRPARLELTRRYAAYRRYGYAAAWVAVAAGLGTWALLGGGWAVAATATTFAAYVLWRRGVPRIAALPAIGGLDGDGLHAFGTRTGWDRIAAFTVRPAGLWPAVTFVPRDGDLAARLTLGGIQVEQPLEQVIRVAYGHLEGRPALV